ncbi:MAG: histidine phosphatase family protein [Desulfobulbaceae bacterium]|nr:histidine phosphatase family protein [Desulfobulbaceae bacterium]
MKQLLLCRHAKSSWKYMDLADIDRPLNKRGRKNAPEMGKRLKQRQVKPDRIVSSPARRAFETALAIAGELGIPGKKILVAEEVYGAYPAKLLKLIRNFDNRHDRVMMVGHNPEITILANLLGGLAIDNVPTGGIVALDFPVSSWEKVTEEKGVLVFFDYPKKGS